MSSPSYNFDMNIHIIFPENSIYMQWMSFFISLSLFFFFLPTRLRMQRID